MNTAGPRDVMGHLLENAHHDAPVVRPGRIGIFVGRNFFGAFPRRFIFKSMYYVDWHVLYLHSDGRQWSKQLAIAKDDPVLRK